MPFRVGGGSQEDKIDSALSHMSQRLSSLTANMDNLNKVVSDLRGMTARVTAGFLLMVGLNRAFSSGLYRLLGGAPNRIFGAMGGSGSTAASRASSSSAQSFSGEDGFHQNLLRQSQERHLLKMAQVQQQHELQMSLAQIREQEQKRKDQENEARWKGIEERKAASQKAKDDRETAQEAKWKRIEEERQNSQKRFDDMLTKSVIRRATRGALAGVLGDSMKKVFGQLGGQELDKKLDFMRDLKRGKIQPKSEAETELLKVLDVLQEDVADDVTGQDKEADQLRKSGAISGLPENTQKAVASYLAGNKTSLVDIETLGLPDKTGYQPPIIQVGATDFTGGQFGEEYSQWVKPTDKELADVTPEEFQKSADLLGLTLEQLSEKIAGGVPLEEALKELQKRIEGAVVVGHKVASFDLPILNKAGLPRVDPANVIDSMHLASQFPKHRPDNKLQTLFGYTGKQAELDQYTKDKGLASRTATSGHEVGADLRMEGEVLRYALGTPAASSRGYDPLLDHSRAKDFALADSTRQTASFNPMTPDEIRDMQASHSPSVTSSSVEQDPYEKLRSFELARKHIQARVNKMPGDTRAAKELASVKSAERDLSEELALKAKNPSTYIHPQPFAGPLDHTGSFSDPDAGPTIPAHLLDYRNNRSKGSSEKAVFGAIHQSLYDRKGLDDKALSGVGETLLNSQSLGSANSEGVIRDLIAALITLREEFAKPADQQNKKTIKDSKSEVAEILHSLKSSSTSGEDLKTPIKTVGAFGKAVGAVGGSIKNWTSKWLGRGVLGTKGTEAQNAEDEKSPIFKMLKGVMSGAKGTLLAGASVGGSLLGAASPDAMGLIQGSFRLLAAVIGQVLIPHAVQLAVGIQGIAQGFRNLSPGMKAVIGQVAKWSLITAAVIVGFNMLIVPLYAAIAGLIRFAASLTVSQGVVGVLALALTGFIAFLFKKKMEQKEIDKKKEAYDQVGNKAVADDKWEEVLAIQDPEQQLRAAEHWRNQHRGAEREHLIRADAHPTTMRGGEGNNIPEDLEQAANFRTHGNAYAQLVEELQRRQQAQNTWYYTDASGKEQSVTTAQKEKMESRGIDINDGPQSAFRRLGNPELSGGLPRMIDSITARLAAVNTDLPQFTRREYRPTTPNLATRAQADKKKENDQMISSFLMSVSSTKASPQYSGIEDAYKRTQIEALGKDPLQLELEKINQQGLKEIFNTLKEMKILSAEQLKALQAVGYTTA